jgi:hypothetical protein
MLANFALPAPDGSVLVAVGLFIVVFVLAAWSVWRQDRNALRGHEAVPHPVSQTDPSPRHVLAQVPGVGAPSRLAAANRGTLKNLRGQGHLDNGPIPLRLWMTVTEIARVLPQHSFSVEILFDARGLSIAEPDFSLSVASLLLHAAQIGRSHHIDLRPLASEHPLYRCSASPQVIVRIATDPEQASLLTYLAERAIGCCQLAEGVGSIEADTNLWLLWPTSKASVRLDLPGPSGPSPQPAPVCA